MMVVFASRSEKKTIMTVRRILDTFAERIGNDTWRTVITEEGLATVKMLLREKATKNMAVACHWIRSRSRSELLWIVGNREKFNVQGIVPVNTTSKNLSHSEWESDWKYMPQMTPIVALAALFHDWGKANDAFQKKLKKSEKTGDEFRHEWISCRMLAALVASCGDSSDDRAWLSQLSEKEIGKKWGLKLLPASETDTLGGLPPLASIISWLILSHHRLPSLPYFSKERIQMYEETPIPSFSDMVSEIKSDWGYQNEQDASKPVKFKNGMLEDSSVWLQQLHKWAKRALKEYEKILALWENGALRPALGYMRLSMMMADYSVSSQEAETDWKGNNNLYANTENKVLKQRLDEHLVGVAAQALKILRRLPQFTKRMESARDIRSLRKKSPSLFSWQDKAVEKIEDLRKECSSDCGWFIVNMASTGCGKTIANAKLMRAISPSGDELRYVLALGLRSLTLQTGEEYRDRIGLSRDELAVLIGDTATRELHEAHREKHMMEDSGAVEKRDALLDGDLDYSVDSENDFLQILFQNAKNSKKQEAFLYKPVVAATIDHIVAATETVRGGKYMLPFLRLMTSDLVIDEVDDFGPDDLWAIARLVYLTGMLGRSAAISSATIPPDLAEALFYAYQSGRGLYLSFLGKKEETVCVWCDEFGAKADRMTEIQAKVAWTHFSALHRDFVGKRVKKLRIQLVKRKARIVDCGADAVEQAESDEKSRIACYYSNLRDAAVDLHDAHGMIDRISGKKISFGVIRMANIDPCVAVSKFLLASEWKQGYDVRLMTYHSRQTRLLRHKQERYLDSVLKRKGEWQKAILEKDPILRSHINGTDADNLLFIVVATPVEEIGRDHDFDWAVVEPSSYRSIIQLAGRVLRHRSLGGDIGAPNIAVMRYNLRGMRSASKAFCFPGYETGGKYRLQSHDMKTLTDEKDLLAGIQSIPRIQKPALILSKERLIDLEHQVMQDFNDIDKNGLAHLRGYLDEYWWLTGMPQTLRRFRDGQPQLELYYCYGDEGDDLGFFERDKEGDYVPVAKRNSKKYNIECETSLLGKDATHLWLTRDYEEALWEEADIEQGDALESMKAIRRLAKRYGGVSVPVSYIDNQEKMTYSDTFGLYRNKYEIE